ncbi:MAG: S8 family serine peptidase, partial [Lachnospiraceae bacterium]|nr:S8 family serine peptidase [Lachnospiraceae bacterium]
MKKQKVKRFWATLLAIGVVITTVFPGTTYADEIGTQISEPVKVEEQSDPVEDGEEQTDSEVKPAGDSNILLLSSETVPEDVLGAVAVEQLAGAVRLTYESAELSKNAFDAFTAMGIACEYDIQVEMLDKEPEKVEELNPTEVPTEDIAVVEELNEEPVAVESASKEKSVKVAVIDTGCDLNVISGRIADGTDMSVTDVNGHGTLMTEIIASQTTEKVKILPIKAFDDNGYSTVGQVYDAIMRAIDLGADVINLSMSGVGSSQMLTHAINKATEKGIIVVVSAGNDASDVEGFMPGNIDSAITVSATDRNEVFAEYSNFGEKIDYSAVGEIIKDQGTEDTSDDTYYSGTSIAAAFVSGYAACVKDNNPEADILGTFDKYANDLGEA